MAITLSTSNSYVTNLADADAYFVEHFTAIETDVWGGASTEHKKAALIEATSILERLNWAGAKADEDQTLQFPRGDDTTVPTDIQQACMESAYALLDGVDPDLEYERLGMKSQGLYSVRATYDHKRVQAHVLAGVPSIRAWRLLFPYLRESRSVQTSRVS
jgi:hypothetical protein